MKQKILAQGAEAVIERKGNFIIKDRTPKSYRHAQLDNKLRGMRTKAEAKLIDKASKLVPAPKLIVPDSKSSKESQHANYQLKIEFINGKKLVDSLDNLKNKYKICKEIGKSLAKLHDAGIIHGDLTTSNLIYGNIAHSPTISKNKVHFIDFGLGFHSNRIEDKAVDLHLIKEALQAKHPAISEAAFKAILAGYKSSKDYSQTIKQLEKVERRGRYKAQY